MLKYLDRQLSKAQRRKVARYMTQYNHLGAIIKSKRHDLINVKTSTLKEINVQESQSTEFEQDKYLKKIMELDGLESIKKKLDYVYETAKPIHRLIWDEHFINGTRDFEIYYNDDNNLSKKTYYNEKNEIMQVVAECLLDTI